MPNVFKNTLCEMYSNLQVGELEARVREGGEEKDSRARQLTNRVMELMKELELTHERQQETEERLQVPSLTSLCYGEPLSMA